MASNYLDVGVTTKKDLLRAEIVLNIRNNLIEKINIYIGGLFYPEIVPEDWEAYTLKGILQGYGIPSKVLLSVQLPREPVANPSQVLYSYGLFYAEANMFIIYSQVGPIERKAIYSLCPLKPTEKPSYLNLTLGFKGEDSFSNWVELSEVTTLSNADFHEMFIQGNENACIEVSGELLEKTAP